MSETFEAVRQQRDAAVRWIGIVGEELVNAGFPAGDRTVQLKNLRVLIESHKEKTQVLSQWEALFTRFLAIGKFHALVDSLMERTRDVLGRKS